MSRPDETPGGLINTFVPSCFKMTVSFSKESFSFEQMLFNEMKKPPVLKSNRQKL